MHLFYTKGESLLSLIHDGCMLLSKEESIIGDMYRSNNLHILSPVKCCTDLNSNFPNIFAR